MGNPMAKQVRAVRGEIYGENNFVDNGDGTVSDLATGLMWAKADNGKGIEWVEALPYAEGATLAGHSDWRLPNVKELQSIVDYSRAPISGRVEAAIDPIFSCTPFVNEAGVWGVRSIAAYVREHIMHHKIIAVVICIGLCVTYCRIRWIICPTFNKT